MKKIGIYQISNKVNDTVYIGRSEDIYTRWKRHKTDLLNGVHKNNYLQDFYNKHGDDCFEYEILEECSLSELAYKELDYIYWFYPDVFNKVSWKDYLRYQLAVNLSKYGFNIEIDYKDERCKGYSGRPLNWAIHLVKDNHHYFVHIANLDYEDSFKYDDERDSFIKLNGYHLSNILYSNNEQESDIIKMVTKTQNEIIQRAEAISQLFYIA